METAADALLYRPLRVVGMVADAVPFAVNRLGDHTFVVVVIGSAFHVYNLDKLAVCMISRPAPGPIAHIEVVNHYTYAAVGAAIHSYYRAKIVDTLTYHSVVVNGMLAVGKLLISYDAKNHVNVYDTKDKLIVSNFSILRDSPVSVAFHPATYLNKMLFGFEDGSIELWNLRSRKLLHTFRCHTKSLNTPSKVTSIAQSPACDVLAIGFESGDILIINARLDIVLFHFRQKGTVTSLTFRTDAQADQSPYLASSSSSGGVSFWRIGQEDESGDQRGRGRLITMLPSMHRGSISRLFFAVGEPLLLSAGTDNSIKVWIFDNSGTGSSPCRLLRERQGFASAPRRLRCFHGSANGSSDYDAGEEIVCAEGRGVLRSARSSAPHLLQEFSRANLPFESLPECVDFDFSSADHPWGTLASIHAQCTSAFLWSLRDHAVSTIILKRSDADARKDRSPNATARGATAVCVTACGNFAVVGYRDGFAIKFNLQSGLQRGGFPRPALEANAPAEAAAGVHTSAVTGLAVDLRNLVMASCGQDGRVVFWNFLTQLPVSQERFLSPLVMLRANLEAGLVAVADERSCIRLLDMATFRLCRVFAPGHSQPTTDLSFSNDGRRLLSCSSDCTLRVWEISSARCLNYVLLPSPPQALTVARNGDLLIAEHGSRFVRILYDASLTQVVHLWKEPTLPTPLSLAEDKQILEEPDETAQNVDAQVLTTKHMSELALNATVATSTLPRLLWSTLFRRRSGVSEAELKKPIVRQAIPFYLQASGDLSGRIVFNGAPAKADETSVDAASAAVVPANGSRLLGKNKKSRAVALSLHNGKFAEVAKRFCSLDADERAGAVTEMDRLLLQTSPQACEVEIRDLCRHSEDLEGFRLLKAFLGVLAALVQRGKSFEVVQAYVYLTLFVHGENIIRCFSMKEEMSGLQASLFQRGEEMRAKVSATLCYIKAVLGTSLL